MQEIFLSKLHQFSLGYNVLDVSASNRDVYLWGDKCVTSAQLNRPIWN
jgi:hypothetical protein